MSSSSEWPPDFMPPDHNILGSPTLIPEGPPKIADQHLIMGIDPAPSKQTIIFDGEDYHAFDPTSVSGFVEERLRANPIIAWDAPLIFNPANGFYDRPVDKELREFTRHEPAANVVAFARLPHWSLTCHVLGYPFGCPRNGLQLVNRPQDLRTGSAVIEVHPALALLVWWKICDATGKEMPAYKKGKNVGHDRAIEGVKRILKQVHSELRTVDRVEEALERWRVECEQRKPGKGHRKPQIDDYLDATVAYELGHRFLDGETYTVGNLEDGFVILPLEAVACLWIVASLPR